MHHTSIFSHITYLIIFKTCTKDFLFSPMVIFHSHFTDTFRPTCPFLIFRLVQILVLTLFEVICIFPGCFSFLFFSFLATIAKMERKLTLCQESLEGQRCAIRDFARDKGQTYLIADRDQLSIAP